MGADPSPRTARDALIYDLLGDVGRLHDEVKALPDKLAPIAGTITNAADRLETVAATTSDTFTKSAMVALKEAQTNIARHGVETADVMRRKLDADFLERKIELQRVQSNILETMQTAVRRANLRTAIVSSLTTGVTVALIAWFLR